MSLEYLEEEFEESNITRTQFNLWINRKINLAENGTKQVRKKHINIKSHILVFTNFTFFSLDDPSSHQSLRDYNFGSQF